MDSRHIIEDFDPEGCRVRRELSARSHRSGEWEEAERIRDLPEVDEALLNFKDDCTGDNAAMVVLAVMRATSGVAASEVWSPAPGENVRNCLDNSLKRAAELLRSTGHAGDAIDAQRIEYQRELNVVGVALHRAAVAEVRAAMVLGQETTVICPLVDGGTLPAGTKLYAHPPGMPSGETDAQRQEVVAAWNGLPDALKAHPGLKRLYRALGGVPDRHGAAPVHPPLPTPERRDRMWRPGELAAARNAGVALGRAPEPKMPRWPAYVCRDECQEAKAGREHCDGTCRVAHGVDSSRAAPTIYKAGDLHFDSDVCLASQVLAALGVKTSDGGQR